MEAREVQRAKGKSYQRSRSLARIARGMTRAGAGGLLFFAVTPVSLQFQKWEEGAEIFRILNQGPVESKGHFLCVYGS